MSIPLKGETDQTHQLSEGRSYCSGATLLYVLLLSSLLAVLLTLAGLRDDGEFWQALGLNVLFVVWTGLLTLLMLCLLARALALSSVFVVALSTIALVLCFVAGLSMLVVWFVDFFQLGDSMAGAAPGLFMIRNLGIALIVSLVISRYLVLQEQWRFQVRAETQASLQALQARIRPHFLFNTLNTIASLIADRPVQAEQATLDLADLLRTGLKDEAHHSLGDELALVRGYLRIEALRLGDRLQLEWALDDALPLDRRMPALLLQPLVENAIVHGIARLPEGGVLRIEGRLRRSRRVRFVIENPFPVGVVTSSQGSRLALENIRQRLALAFEQGGRLKTEQGAGQFKATLDLPEVS
jgi:two-component system, LytTR family, sensor histidine kinase AlgZ